MDFRQRMQQRRIAPQTVNELCDRYLAHADTYYRKPTRTGERAPTREATNVKDAMRALRAVCGDKPPTEVVAEDLCDCQHWFLEQRHRGEPPSREVINARIGRIKRVFKWASTPPQRWLPPSVLGDLMLVEHLQPNRTEARELPDVQPVPEEHYKATLIALAEEGLTRRRSIISQRLATMIEVQWHSGMRPGELCGMWKDELVIETAQLFMWDEPESVELMIYQPASHKLLHHNIDRNVFLGPEARRLISDWLTRVPKWEKRLFPYTVNSYRQELARVQKRHNIPHWSPNRLRHSFATRMRTVARIDVLQVLMGHRRSSTTEIYAKPDAAAAIEAICRFG